MPRHITLQAGDTEPLEIVVSATGLANLDDVSTAELYMRLKDASTNHVDGVSLTISDSAARKVEFDPVGAKSGGGDALDAEGRYLAYVKLTFNDGDFTRHPGFPRFLVVDVIPNYE